MRNTSNKILLLCIAVVMTMHVSATTYYFSQNSGNDMNAGTSPASPKKSIGAALPLMGFGNILKFKAGEQWYLPVHAMDMRGKSNFTIDSFGTGKLPYIAGMSILADVSWTYDGLGIWKYATVYDSVYRVFVNNVSRIDVQYERGKHDSLSNLTNTHEYFFDKATKYLYIYTGSSLIGPKSVEIIPSLGLATDTIATVMMKNTSDVTIRNIDLAGGSRWNIVQILAPCRNITIDNCIIEKASGWGSGILVADTLVNTDYVANITITNNLIDKGWTTAENNTFMTLKGEGIFLLDGVDTGLVKDNVVINWGHVGITLTSYRAAYPSIHGVHHITVDHNDVSADSSGYMHGLDVSGLASLTTFNFIKRNNFHNYTTMCHIAGSNNFFFSNIFNGVVGTTLLPQHSYQPHGADLVPWARSIGFMEAKNNWIFNNTFANTGGLSLWLGSNGNINPNVDMNVVANNIFYDFGPHPFGGPGSTYTPLGLGVDTGAGGTNYFRNNNFWAGSGTAVVVNYKARPVFYTAAAFNSLSPSNVSNNFQFDPQFDPQFRLVAGSDVSLRTGGIDYWTTQLYMYMNHSDFVDYFGTQWRTSGPGPSRGAIQY